MESRHTNADKCFNANELKRFAYLSNTTIKSFFTLNNGSQKKKQKKDSTRGPVGRKQLRNRS
jgi:hypothetical protein